MRTRFLAYMVFCLLVLDTTPCVQAADLSGDTGKWYLEGGLPAYVNDGYSVVVRRVSDSNPQYVFGAGIFGMDLPPEVAESESANFNKGWSVRLSTGAGLFWDYYFDPERRGLFAGLHASYQDFRLSNSNYKGIRKHFQTLFFMPRLGYEWHPFDKKYFNNNKFEGLFVAPFIGLGFSQKLDGNTDIASERYKIALWVPLFFIHVGYQF